ncbi:MAG: C39 family peptidase, partial [Oscillospiraceae bacterium]|nr:C39 family peptidase [Oscillospiraceae bacterium]
TVTEVTTASAVTEPAVTTVTTAGTAETEKAVRLEVDSVLQMPELPKGCEATALTMLLNHYGFSASKTQIADMMPKFNFYIIDDVLYGADFVHTYPGNPRSGVAGCGCYTPCMVSTAEKYFNSIGESDYSLRDITGSELETLLSYIDAGRPVMVWASRDMVEDEYIKEWTTPDGRQVKWNENEHCYILTGYDRVSNTVYVNDPLKGKTSYSMSVFKLRYNQMGKYAAVINGSGIKEPQKPVSPSVPGTYRVGDVIEYTGTVYYSAGGGKSAEVSGVYEITEILDDETKPYRIRLGTAGWVPYDFR